MKTPKVWTVGAMLQWTVDFFTQKGLESARLDAEILLAHVLQKERIYLYAHYDEPVSAKEREAYRALVIKRAQRYSVAHILGTRPFMGLDFAVNEDVLVPRPETEMLVETVLCREAEGAAFSLLDMGTGSGAIIISILHERPEATGLAVDVSEKALAVAKKNGEALGVADRLRFLESNLFANVPKETFHWIVSNPPYLTAEDMEHLQPEVRHDPESALYGGVDGLDFYRVLARESASYLKPRGYIAVEVGSGQNKAVADLFTATGTFSLVDIVVDYGGIERVVLCQRKE